MIFVKAGDGDGLREDDDDEEGPARRSSSSHSEEVFGCRLLWLVAAGVILRLEEEEGVSFSSPSNAVDDFVGIGCNGAPIPLEEDGVEVEPEPNCSQFPNPANCCLSFSSFNLFSSII
jgi:hypothetical protein